jgi:hypothetical protein
MKKVNYLFLLFAVLFSVFILFISLQSANKNELKGNPSLMSGKFYVAKEILPDHSLYPLLMIVDRLRLEMSDSEKRTYLLVSYSNRRLFYSKKLLDKGNSSLALITMDKALKYLNRAMHENIVLLEKENNNKKTEDQSLAFFVLESFDKHMDFITNNKNKFNNEESAALESLSIQSLSLADKLRLLAK